MKNDTFKTFANSFQAIARLRLESIECLLKHLGEPQNALKFIHVAGTNGKGSVCSFLQCIFSAAGYRTGKYTSPNLISVCERISIDGEFIDEAELSQLLNAVEIGVEKVKEEIGDSPTQFEIWTAAAFLYFKEMCCDIVILETGLGGTRDATNVIPAPLASVITRLDLDHTEYLGDTLAEIATEKAGIIKSQPNGSQGLCITAPQNPEAISVLKDVCLEKNNRLIVANLPQLQGFESFCEIISYTSADGLVELENIHCGISGFYQTENATLAIETALALGISPEFIKAGIKTAKNPARFELIQNKPPVIYDGAHNRNGVSALVTSLKRYFSDWNGATFIMAFMGDKDIYGVFSALKVSGLLENSEIFVVQVKDNPRAANPGDVCKIAAPLGVRITPYKELFLAYQTALSKGQPVIICGSLYLYKDFDEIKDIQH